MAASEKTEGLFVGALVVRAVLFGVLIRAPDLWKHSNSPLIGNLDRGSDGPAASAAGACAPVS